MGREREAVSQEKKSNHSICEDQYILMGTKNQRKFLFSVCKVLNLDDSGVEGKGLLLIFCGYAHVLPDFFILACCPILPS